MKRRIRNSINSRMMIQMMDTVMMMMVSSKRKTSRILRL